MLLCPWDFPGNNTGVGWHFLLQGIFPMRGSNLSLLHLLHWQARSLSGKPDTDLAFGNFTLPLFIVTCKYSEYKFRRFLFVCLFKQGRLKIAEVCLCSTVKPAVF